MREALVLMAKAPRAGEVKTRLIGALTTEQANELYISFLSDTFALMEAVWDERETLSLVLCYTPEGAEEAFESVEREGSMMLAQRGADLGERLSNCFADLVESDFESVIVIGADSPTLPAKFLVEALERLNNENDIVIGPAEDGGYYLIGMKKPHQRIFAEIPWSTSGVMAATRERAREAGLNLIELSVWYDVDTPEELERLEQDLNSKKATARFTQTFLKKLRKERKS